MHGEVRHCVIECGARETGPAREYIEETKEEEEVSGGNAR